jgi:adenylosuccinate synthase
MINGATHLAVTKLDCVFPGCRGARTFEQLPVEGKQFIERVEEETKVPVSLMGTGPDVLDVIDRRE